MSRPPRLRPREAPGWAAVRLQAAWQHTGLPAHAEALQGRVAFAWPAIADTTRPLALYESGFAPRWYVPRADVDTSALTPAEDKTFCPYKGMCCYWDISGLRRAVWGYEDAWPEVGRISGMLSFELDKVEVRLDGARLQPEPGQAVIAHGADRDLSPGEIALGMTR
jgi:uncharacterized protein (DUF427 family)